MIMLDGLRKGVRVVDATTCHLVADSKRRRRRRAATRVVAALFDCSASIGLLLVVYAARSTRQPLGRIHRQEQQSRLAKLAFPQRPHALHPRSDAHLRHGSTQRSAHQQHALQRRRQLAAIILLRALQPQHPRAQRNRRASRSARRARLSARARRGAARHANSARASTSRCELAHNARARFASRCIERFQLENSVSPTQRHAFIMKHINRLSAGPGAQFLARFGITIITSTNDVRIYSRPLPRIRVGRDQIINVQPNVSGGWRKAAFLCQSLVFAGLVFPLHFKQHGHFGD